MLITKFRIFDDASVAERISKMLAGFGNMIQFTRWNIIPQHIPTIIGKPHVPRFWMPGETYRIADTFGINLPITAIWVHSGNGAKTLILIGTVTNIAGCAYRNVEFIIWSKGYIFPSMMKFRRIVVIDQFFFGSSL